ncbi:helix-turn-helix domain-containing protein [Kitasatospora sp. NPDC004669]|uniref:helix-turn-helix domain-containing protein n=1 Tax=Kitasatospora sp. NPDC004669 TaxID=3154555 RepID=UPI0033BCF21A
MSNILRIELTIDQRRELRELLARRDLTRYTRQRAECIRLLDRGKTAPEVADLLECNVVTVRAAAHRLHDGGVEALPDAPRPGRPARVLGDDDRAGTAAGRLRRGRDHLDRPGTARVAARTARGGHLRRLALGAAAPRRLPLETNP